MQENGACGHCAPGCGLLEGYCPTPRHKIHNYSLLILINFWRHIVAYYLLPPDLDSILSELNFHAILKFSHTKAVRETLKKHVHQYSIRSITKVTQS
jgi:hypothetical protein